MTNRQPTDLDWEMLDRYFSGEASAEEIAIVSRLSTRPEGAALLRSVREIWDAAGVIPAPSSPDLDAAWRSVSDGMMREEAGKRETHVAGPSRSTPQGLRLYRATSGRQRYLSYALRAASVIVVVALGAIAFRVVGSGRSTSLTATAPQSARELVTKRGERATLDLADGSHVVLGPETRLTIPARFNEAKNSHSRELGLTGEAYFTVTHDSTRPFRVATATAVTEDIGTAFVVSAYPELRGTRVVVEEGSVALRGVGKPAVVVTPGKLALIDSSGVSLVPGVSVASYISWTRGQLVFDGARLAEAIPQLERWYDLEVKVADSAILARRLTGSFTNASAERMLEQLSFALDVKVNHSGRAVLLCAHRGDRVCE